MINLYINMSKRTIINQIQFINNLQLNLRNFNFVYKNKRKQKYLFKFNINDEDKFKKYYPNYDLLIDAKEIIKYKKIDIKGILEDNEINIEKIIEKKDINLCEINLNANQSKYQKSFEKLRTIYSEKENQSITS